MKEKIKYSGFAIFAALLIMLLFSVIASFFAGKLDDPDTVYSISAAVCLLSSSLLCGLIAQIRSRGDSVCILLSAAGFITVLLIISLLWNNIVNVNNSHNIALKLIMYVAAFAFVYLGSFFGRKKKKRSTASVRAGLMKKRRA